MANEAKTLGTAEVAKRLKISPKDLRAHLRSVGKGAKGERYEFHEKDLPKLIAAIKEHQLKPEEK
jgi:hypothetical protein